MEMQRSFKADEQPKAQDEVPSDANPKADDSLGDSETEQNDDAPSNPSGPDAASASLPDDNCILFGRGKGTNNRPANRRMRSIIDGYRDQYQAVGRGEKLKLVRRVHEEIVETGMKFLKQVEGENKWAEVDAADAIKKVGHALRCNRNDNRRQRNPDPANQPNASDESLLIQRASAVPQGGLFPGPAMASTAVGSNFLGHRDLTGMSSNHMLQNLLLDGALGGPRIPRFASLGASYPSLSLESQLLGMQMNRLRSAASLPIPAAPLGDLGGLSAEQLRLLIEREQQIRLMLLNDASILPRQPPTEPPP